MNDIGALIAQLGFPIVICLLMMWYINKSNDKHMDQIVDITNQHREEMKEVTTALNNNTLALQKLTDYIKKEDKLDV